MQTAATGATDAYKAETVRNPDDFHGYDRLARVALQSGDLQLFSRGVLSSFLLNGSCDIASEDTLKKLLPYVSKCSLVPILWNIAERGSGRFIFEESLEQKIALSDRIEKEKTESYLKYLFRRTDIGRTSIPYMICGMPKSASTYLSGLLADAVDLPLETPHNYNDFIGTGFDKGRIWDICQCESVVHGHLMAGWRTQCYFKLLNVRPIVTTRNIFDALRSYVDMMTPADLAGRDFESWMHFLCMRSAAFFVEFYAGWYQVRHRFDILWVRYEDTRENPESVLRALCSHLSIDIDDARVNRIVDAHRPDEMSEKRKRELMFNQGRSGRGKELPEEIRSYVRRMYAIYPDVDFSAIDDAFQSEAASQTL